MNIYSKGCPFTEQPSPFYLHLLFLVFNRTYTYTVPIRFGKHVTYALTFGSDTRSIDLVFIDQNSLYGFRTCSGNSCIDFSTTFRRSIPLNDYFCISIFLHIPPEEGTPPLQQYIPYLPIGQRLFAVSLLAHEIYLRQDYAKAKGVVQGAFLMADGVYPISMIYLGCVQAMCQINLKEQEEAIQTVSQAWEWARFDKFMEPFIEYHGLLQGVLEVCIRKKESVMHLQAGIQMQNVRKSTKRICRIRI